MSTLYAPLTIDSTQRALFMCEYGYRGSDEEVFAWAKRRSISECVYFIRGGPLIKIGFTKDVDDRLKSLRRNSPEELVLVATQTGGREMETKLHRRFWKARRHGEWFKFTDAIYWHIVTNANVHVDIQTLRDRKHGHRT